MENRNENGLPIIITEEAPFELVSRKPILPSKEELEAEGVVVNIL